MCARVAQLILAAFFVFVVATVAAFRYLEWWQAIIASAITFFLMVFGAKMLIKSFLGNLGNLAKGLFETKSKVLRGATIQVHSVSPTEVPAEALPSEEDEEEETDPDDEDEEGEKPTDPRDLSWYQIETTIFPDQNAAGPMTHWDIDDLRLVPSDAPPMSMDDDDNEGDRPEFDLLEVRVVTDGQPQEPDGSKFLGPQRLRFKSGFPKGVREVKFQYYFENFGVIPLTPALPR
jgi:hypothetical protein